VSYLNTYLRQAVENIRDSLATLTDSDGDRVAGRVQSFLFPYPTTPTWICVHPFGLSFTQQPAGMPWQRQVWTIAIRIGVGSMGQDYVGNVQEKLWETIPLVSNYLFTHPHLTFTNTQAIPDYLDTGAGIGVPSIRGIGDEQLQSGNVLWVELGVPVPFNVPLTLLKHQDGKEIEVT